MKKKEYTKINIIDTNTGIVMTIQPNEYMSEFRFRRVKQRRNILKKKDKKIW